MAFQLIKSPFFIVKQLQVEMIQHMGIPHVEYLLDVGCGHKPYKKYVNTKIYIGIDLNKKVKPDLVASADRLPFLNSSFGGIICCEIIEHVKSPEKVLKELNRVLSENGFIYLTVPMTWPLHYEPYDYFRFTKYGIKYLLEKNGFQCEKIERIGGVFSIIGARLADIIFHLIVRSLSFLGSRNAERIASLFIMPISIFYYFIGKTFDKVDSRDAIGWAVLAKKEKP